ncbi:hypothetical protein TWF506_002864 [Arthrobotrys conoides]|uniref:F-box domain-containing protein n=1 Tax=Arthrobotrys conoides TaxID=74498 RepID=A0AAN8MYA7_9PEZI
MASLTRFPTEVLIQIFNDKSLDPSDFARCARTCKRFRDVIYYSGSCGLDYNFQVDHTSQSAWKFTRVLLANPQAGQRIRKIEVTWHRRHRRFKNTWTKIWNWTEEELSKIYDICEQWKIRSVYPAIRDGFNSEALLPLILCCTSDLKVLNIGDPSKELIYNTRGHSYRMVDVRRMFNYKREDGERWNIQHWYDSGGATFSSRGRARRNCILWMYSAMTSEPWLPGFASLREFSSGLREFPPGSAQSVFTQRASWDSTSVINLAKITALPSLETLRLYNLGSAADLGKHYIDPLEQAPTSSLRHLELINCFWLEGFCERIARLTRDSLQSYTHIGAVNTCNTYLFSQEWKIEGYDPDEICQARVTIEDEMAAIFQQAKMKKLKREKIHFMEFEDIHVYDLECYSSEWDPSEDRITRSKDPYLLKKAKDIDWDSDDAMGDEFFDINQKQKVDDSIYYEETFWLPQDFMPNAIEDLNETVKTRHVKGRKRRSHFVA